MKIEHDARLLAEVPMNGLDGDVLLQGVEAQLAANPTLLLAAERH
jgi:hypothetical protein